MDDIRLSPGFIVGPALSRLNLHYHSLFSAAASFFDFWVHGIVTLLSLAPAPVTAGILAILAGLLSGWQKALLTMAGLLFCTVLGMWSTTVQTISLVVLSILFSILAGFPIGVLLSRSARAEMVARPFLDIMQTLPPWVYLVPTVILFGLGTVPALLSTIVYGIAPMVRLTILAMAQIPKGRLELGTQSVQKKVKFFTKSNCHRPCLRFWSALTSAFYSLLRWLSLPGSLEQGDWGLR